MLELDFKALYDLSPEHFFNFLRHHSPGWAHYALVMLPSHLSVEYSQPTAVEASVPHAI